MAVSTGSRPHRSASFQASSRNLASAVSVVSRKKLACSVASASSDVASSCRRRSAARWKCSSTVRCVDRNCGGRSDDVALVEPRVAQIASHLPHQPHPERLAGGRRHGADLVIEPGHPHCKGQWQRSIGEIGALVLEEGALDLQGRQARRRRFFPGRYPMSASSAEARSADAGRWSAAPSPDSLSAGKYPPAGKRPRSAAHRQ